MSDSERFDQNDNKHTTEPESATDTDSSLDESSRRLKLEELRFRLEERRADHDMMVELRELDLKESFLEKDRQLLLGENEHWMKSYWRPAAGWIYLTICLMDFVVFPLMIILAPLVGQLFGLSVVYEPWTPITLTEGGLIHLSFGAVLGVTAWTRGQEKLRQLSGN